MFVKIKLKLFLQQDVQYTLPVLLLMCVVVVSVGKALHINKCIKSCSIIEICPGFLYDIIHACGDKICVIPGTICGRICVFVHLLPLIVIHIALKPPGHV